MFVVCQSRECVCMFAIYRYIVSEEHQQWSKRRIYGLVELYVAGSRRDISRIYMYMNNVYTCSRWLSYVYDDKPTD